MENMEGIIIPLAFFGAVFVILYVFFTTRNKERLAMIEKGADASLFAHGKRRGGALKFGMLFVGVALGIFAGNMLQRFVGFPEEAAYFSMIFLFGGASLIAYSLIEKKNCKNEVE